MSGDSKLGSTEHLFKVLVIGDSDVGKTSFVKRYVRDQFFEDLKTTIGVDFSMKVIEWDSQTLVRLQLWDIGGQERVRGMNRVYFKGSSGAVVVYDMTNGSTLEGALNWKRELDCKVMLKNGRPIPAVLLANKCDQIKLCQRNAAVLEKLCQEKGFIGWFETSAKENFNVDKAAKFLVKHILQVNQESENEEVQEIQINLTQQSNTNSTCC
ncbi:ras-related protein Rab-32-like [Myxocyprinus asiaticus]|uniref:ras-related protein Rab-32-like n=1 Tax=Myxocyprinus asiaticus TaxID=70543 RepID=UPI00222287ED|nr:ras-related protein Rab-32-like [Myxocyprinus asiaticus]